MEKESDGGEEVCIGKGTDSSLMFWWYCFVVFYMFLGLAIICDDFFVPALEEIGEGLGM